MSELKIKELVSYQPKQKTATSMISLVIPPDLLIFGYKFL
jgi:hypothetical protein